MAISWQSVFVALPKSDFELRNSICLNNCKGKFIDLSESDTLYSSLFAHGFISQLSAVNSFEDFAESFAVYVASKYMDLHFEIQVEGQRKYKLDDVLKSQEFQPKLTFIKTQFPN